MIQVLKACRRRRRTIYAIRVAVNRYFSNTAGLKKSYRRGRLEAIEAKGTNRGNAVDGGSRLWDTRDERLSGSVLERIA